MFFGQKVHPASFEYGSRASCKGGSVKISGESFQARLRCAGIGDFATLLTIENGNVQDDRDYSDGVVEQYRCGKPIEPRGGRQIRFETEAATVEVKASALRIALPYGLTLETAGEGFGFNGVKSIFNFHIPAATGFYGFGERTKRFNKSGDSLDFYTIDVAGVFVHTSTRDDYDPNYVSIPFAILRIGGQYCGLFFDSPERLLMDCGQIAPGHFITQAMDGHTRLYVINGPALRDVARNFSTLTGRAELPPAWAIGYHQCRWGYQTAREFETLAANFAKHDLPVSGFWYDIDYMNEYRVFTWDKRDIPAPRKLNETLKRHGIHTVTIIDPGVKLDPGYAVYDNGKKADIFCKTASGKDYVGRVWPGDTVFPDFSTEQGQEWWAGHVAKFLKSFAIDGGWLDMNDPATGWCDPEDMLFEKGATPHAKYHNQYGHLMAKATRRAFEILDPQRRPFLLTRSGYTGTQRYSAIWNGDNDSNWKHLRMSIPCTLNLGLSGVAFNGPDVGGFMGHTTPELLIRWYQAGFLFPFFRNHTITDSKTQEPWEFGPQILAHIRDVLHTRYRLLPYLYQCFFQHHLTGDPILRPLLYEFEGRELENMGDQFLAGSFLMAAPIVQSLENADSIVVRGERRQLRYITFPAGWWYDLNTGEWVEGGKTLHYAAGMGEVPLFARDGAILPWFAGKMQNGLTPLNDFELHIFAHDGMGGAQATFHLDDQKTRKYLDGAYNDAAVRVDFSGSAAQLEVSETGPLPKGAVNLTRAVFYGAPGLKTVRVSSHAQPRKLKNGTRRWVAKAIPVLAV